jgi:membrane protein implicated in regulation of membrane protease activity
MSRVTWTLYLIGSALVLGSWLGIVDPTVAWIGWFVATGISLWSWRHRLAPSKPQNFYFKSRSKPAPAFTAEEEEAARREVQGDEE